MKNIVPGDEINFTELFFPSPKFLYFFFQQIVKIRHHSWITLRNQLFHSFSRNYIHIDYSFCEFHIIQVFIIFRKVYLPKVTLAIFKKSENFQNIFGLIFQWKTRQCWVPFCPFQTRRYNYYKTVINFTISYNFNKKKILD